MGFKGYPRPDGSCGVRNHVVVMSTVSCANGVVDAIAREVPGIKPLTHTEGCGRGLTDLGIANRTLTGLGKNPNVAALLLIGLGCEFIKADFLAQMTGAAKKPVEHLIIQDQRGSQNTARKGIEIAKNLLDYARSIRPEECGWDRLTLGLECGGSDAMSGVTANPMVGVAADWLVEEGGTVILSETTEMIGTEHILSRRARDPDTAEKVMNLILNQKKKAEELLGPFAGISISPGNIEGGLSSIVEKSLGCIIKAGNSPINEVLEYGAIPTQKGLVIMDTPGSDIFSLTGMAAGGSQIMVFTTGRGTPAGFPIVPVIKVSSNSETFENMKDDMDLDAGRIIKGVSIEDAGAELIEFIKRVAGGEMPKAEANRQDVLSIYTVEPPF
jgi:altronate dehydratase large subunit